MAKTGLWMPCAACGGTCVERGGKGARAWSGPCTVCYDSKTKRDTPGLVRPDGAALADLCITDPAVRRAVLVAAAEIMEKRGHIGERLVIGAMLDAAETMRREVKHMEDRDV